MPSFLFNLKTFKPFSWHLRWSAPVALWCGILNILSCLNIFSDLVLNRWGYDKFPKEMPLVFYRAGQPISPPLEMFNGLKVVLENMVSYIQKEVPSKTLKFWRLQSPRHFYGGDWNQNGSCMFNEPLKESQVWINDGSSHFCAFLPRFYVLFCNTNIDHGPYWNHIRYLVISFKFSLTYTVVLDKDFNFLPWLESKSRYTF